MVSSFQINKCSGSLNTVSSVRCGSHGPCHISCNAANSLVAVANYAGGAVTSLAVDASTGNLMHDVRVIRHSGCGPNTNRQAEPHAHCVLFSRDNCYLLVADLGTDQIMTYPVTAAAATAAEVSARASSVVTAEGGSGPRSMVWHPHLDILYVVYELLGAIGVYQFQPHDGSLVYIDTFTATERDEVDAWCAGICILTNGFFLYLAGLCICVYVYMCICVYMYMCICVYVSLCVCNDTASVVVL